MMFGQPQARSYWDGNRFVLAPVPQRQGLLAPQAPAAPQAQAPSAQQSFFQSQIGDGGGSNTNTVGGAQTSTAAAPGGFSSSGQANRASSPSANSGPSYASLGGLTGTMASLATGFMGLGPALGAIGGVADADKANADLAAIGHGDKNVSAGKSALGAALSVGPLSLAPGYTTRGQVGEMGLGLSRQGVAEMADFARGYDGLGLTGFDSPEMDAAYGMNLASMSPLSAAMAPSGLLGGFFGGYSPATDLTSLGSPGLGGYGNLGTAHSYGMVDGSLVGNFTGNEQSTTSQGNDGGGAQGGHGGNSNGAGGSDPDGNGNWRVGGYTGNDRDGKLEAIRGTVHEGEYVIRPEATAYYGQGLLKAINERRIPRGMLFG